MLTDNIAAFAFNTTFEQLPSAAVARAKVCFFDWLVVALLGSKEPYSQAVESALIDTKSLDGDATIIGRKRKTTSFNAALVNGVNSHCLDYDDMHVGMNGHPGVAVFPAVLAIAEAKGASGQSLITAFVIGAEIACRLGTALSPSHYARGWHATSTLGIFGAAIGAAKLLNLEERMVCHAIGFAGTQSAGLQRVFGTAAKPLNAGHAAACGLLSAKLASEGLTASKDIFSGDQGFLNLFAEKVDPAAITDDLGQSFLMEEIVIKRLESCFSTHAPIKAALDLRKRYEDQIRSISRVVVHVSQMAVNVAGITNATTPAEAKFSIGYCVASALSRGDLSIPEGISNKTIQDLASRVHLEVDGTIQHDERKATVVIETLNGGKYRSSVDLFSESPTVEDDWNSVRAKASKLEPESLRVSDLQRDIRSLEGVQDIREFVDSYF